jgi:hypothetical protein
MKREKKILFLLKERFYGSSILSYGLINSATYVANFLDNNFYNCRISTVIDANHIDKEIHSFKPDVVIIEALWVPGGKLKELMELKRYKHIHWIIRVHSDMGFLASETMGIKNINDYIDLYKHNLTIAVNSYQFHNYLSTALNYKIDYLPNIVDVHKKENNEHAERDVINIGCLGALRLLKNQCFQALCSIKAAQILGKQLNFHITKDSGEHKKDNPVLKNLAELFKNTNHKLVVHDWMPNDKFQELIQKMDIGIQLSYTESFNIVCAEFINNHRLIVASDSVSWLPDALKTSDVDYDMATEKIISIYHHRHDPILKFSARNHLRQFNLESEQMWLNFLNR